MSSSSSGIEVEIIKTIAWVQEMDRAVGFYRDTLGLRLGLQRDDWCELHHMGSLIGPHGVGSGGGKTGLCIQVPRIESACAAITAGGGEVVEQPHEKRRSRVRRDLQECLEKTVLLDENGARML